MESIKEPNNDAISTSTGEHPLLIPEVNYHVFKLKINNFNRYYIHLNLISF